MNQSDFHREVHTWSLRFYHRPPKCTKLKAAELESILKYARGDDILWNFAKFKSSQSGEHIQLWIWGDIQNCSGELTDTTLVSCTFLRSPVKTFHLIFPLIGRQVQFSHTQNLQSWKQLLHRKMMGLVTAKWHSTALQTRNDWMTDDRTVTLTVTRFEVFLNVWPAGWLWLAESSLCSLSSGTDAPVSAALSLHPTDWVSAGGQQGAVQPGALRTKRQRPLTHRNHAFFKKKKKRLFNVFQPHFL